MKKAQREELFALSDETAYEITADGDKFQAFLDVQSRLDRYSAVNALLVYAQKPDASRLGDFNYWHNKNCSVRPGQTAISILEPHSYTKDDGSYGTGYNVKKVFDISQIDTRRLREHQTIKNTERQILKALIAKAPVQIVGVDTIPESVPDEFGSFYEPDTNLIFVRKGMEFDNTFRSLTHALAVADFTTGPDEPKDTSFSAYCASYLLCKKYGVDTKEFTFADAPKVFDGMDAQEVKGELSQIRDFADDTAGRMARQLDAQQKAAKAQER